MKHLFLISFMLLLSSLGFSQQISSAVLVKEVSPMYMGEGDTIFDYSCDLTLSSAPTLHHVHISLETDSISGHVLDMEYLEADLPQYEIGTLEYTLPFGPVEISDYTKMRVQIMDSSEAVIEESEIDL